MSNHSSNVTTYVNSTKAMEPPSYSFPISTIVLIIIYVIMIQLMIIMVCYILLQQRNICTFYLQRLILNHIGLILPIYQFPSHTFNPYPQRPNRISPVPPPPLKPPDGVIIINPDPDEQYAFGANIK
jgi:hypothetical protein